MSALLKQGDAVPGGRQIIDDEDILNPALGTKQSTTMQEVQRETTLRQAKHKLGMTQAEWLRLQQEVLKFLKDLEGEIRTNEEAAVAFLNDTGAKDRFFGMLTGGEAEGMLVKGAGLAWGIDDEQIIAQIAAIVSAWGPTASSHDGSRVQGLAKRSADAFDDDNQIPTAKRTLRPKAQGVPLADIAGTLGGTPARYEKDNSLFVEDDEDSEHRHRKETATGPQETRNDKTQPVGSQVQTASETGKDNDTQQALPYFNRPMSFSLDRWLREPEESPTPVIQTPPKPWLKVRLYVGGERLVRDHKHLQVERSMSLDSFNSQVFHLYHWELARARQRTRQNLDKDSIRFYMVHYAIGGGDNVAQVGAHDDGAWEAALDRLHNVGVADQVVLKGHVEVHL